MRERFGEAWDLLFHPPVAHRGLWSPDGPPENSLAAFDAACASGYGIELDVQLTADGEAVVFHDWDLTRLTGAQGRLADRSREALSELRLGGSTEKIPTLAETLDLVAARALVQIELKTPPGAEGPLEERVLDVVSRYRGPFALIGFNARSHAYLGKRRPEILRGLDAASDEALTQGLAVARPHFLALGVDMLPSRAAARHRAEGLPVIAWTVRSAERWEAARDGCDNLIFEGWRP